MESKFKRNVKDFFFKRNGLDDLALISLIIFIIIYIFAIIFPNVYVLFIIGALFLAYGLFRILSKNIYLREKENYIFLSLFKRKNKVKRQKTIKTKKVKKEKVKKVKKDKNYIYKSCPYCNNELKISKGKKGERIVMCGKCFNEVKFKI